MDSKQLAQFEGHSFINLETFRQSGVGVQTPVWFVEDKGQLFVHTGAQSGKVKRIRNNGRVRLTPSDMRGAPKGQWVEGQAELLEPTEYERIEKLFKKKYGVQWTMFSATGRLRKEETVKVVVRLADGSQL
jgi:uncharacterized protein